MVNSGFHVQAELGLVLINRFELARNLFFDLLLDHKFVDLQLPLPDL